MTWSCTCTQFNPDEEPTCRKCGLVRLGPGTHDKYDLLASYLPQLSKIMRNRDYEHYFIDACAGSGFVLDAEKNELCDGSPIIMSKTRERVNTLLKDATKPHQVKCKFIEIDDRTFKHLQEAVGTYDFVECINGDCNEKLDAVLDGISSEVKAENHFAFVYVDPFGLGRPIISQETLKRILERNFTELLIHFSWEGVSRMAGFYHNIDNSDVSLAKQARSYVKSLDAYLGNGWQAIEEKQLPPQRRRNEYVNHYHSTLKQYYPGTIHVEIPFGSSNPDYFLFFATRNPSGNEIMTNIIKTLKRKGNLPLDSFKNQDKQQKQQETYSLDDFFPSAD